MILAKELLTAFEVYLADDAKVGAGSARVYRTLISGFFRWHVGDSPTNEQLAVALEKLRTVDPRGAVNTYTAWRHFRAFAVRRGIMVPEAPTTPSAKRGRKPEGPPARIVGLLASLVMVRDAVWIATHEGLLQLTWGNVRAHSSASVVISNVACRHDKIGHFNYDGAELIEVFRELQLWWGSGALSKELTTKTPLLAAAPLSQQPMGLKALKRALKEGRAEAMQIRAKWAAEHRARAAAVAAAKPPPSHAMKPAQNCEPPKPLPPLDPSMIPLSAGELYKPPPSEFAEANEFALVPVVEEGDIGDPN
jgi:hypothetical protein